MKRVREPFVLISQVPRSGGTLLMRLLDGHPQLWSVPHEWGTPFVEQLGEDPWSDLYDAKIGARYERGYRASKPKARLSGDPFVFEFDLSPVKQERIFRKLEAQRPPASLRAHYNAYMTSYFGAWRGYATAEKEKKWVSAFAPRLALNRRAIKQFFEIYPDGRLISIVRNPSSWYASARRWSPEWEDVEPAIAYWTKGTRVALRWHRVYGERVRLLSFEHLVSDTANQMRMLSDYLEIDFDEGLVEPTFNTQPIKANSSFTVEEAGIIAASADRTSVVADPIREAIEQATSDLYEQALALTR